MLFFNDEGSSVLEIGNSCNTSNASKCPFRICIEFEVMELVQKHSDLAPLYEFTKSNQDLHRVQYVQAMCQPHGLA